MSATSPPHSGKTLPLILLFCLGVSLLCVAYPMYVIRPFRSQGARELMVALAVLRYRPLITVISAIAALAVFVPYWRGQAQKHSRILAAVGCGAVAILAVLARVNIFERMFHPIEHPAFVAAQQTKLDKDEKVIAIRVGRAARAYPIRSLAYHHMVNDVLDQRAIVATY